MREVQNPPALTAQETPAWCFAAAEVMVRRYYGLQEATQYAIARRSLEALASLDPDVQEAWELAAVLDQSGQVDENNGRNMNSHIVQLVRTRWNAFDNAATGGRFITGLTTDMVRTEIDNNRIFVIGNAIHYYVVYGYSEDGEVLHLRDPWPSGRGGERTRITLRELQSVRGSVVIFF